MGADLYREAKPGSNPERELALAALDARADRGENIHDPKEGTPTWGDLKNHPDWYFRDSYNDSSLFWMLGLSWWADLGQYLGPNGDGLMDKVVEDGVEYDDYRLHPAGCLRLADECARRAELLVKNCRDKGLPDTPTDEYGLSVQYFDQKLQRFLAFLRDVAEAGDTIYASV